MIKFFIWQLLLALDQLVNVMFGGYGASPGNGGNGGSGSAGFALIEW